MSAEVSPIGVEHLHFLSLVIFFQLFNLVTTDTSESKYVGARVNGRYTDSSSHRMVSIKLHTHICVERAQTQPPSNSICCVTDALQCTFCLRFLLCFPLSLCMCAHADLVCVRRRRASASPGSALFSEEASRALRWVLHALHTFC